MEEQDNKKSTIDYKQNSFISKDQLSKQIDETADLSKVNLSRYNDPEGLSIGKMNFGLWFVYNREKLKKSVFILIFVFGTFSWLLFFYAFGFYVFVGRGRAALMLNNIINNNLPGHDFFVANGAKDLLLSPVQIIGNNNGNYDLVTQIKNINKDYIADFNYYFTDGQNKVGQQNGFIYPAEAKYFLSINQPISGQFSAYHFQIEDLHWRRINTHTYGNWQEFKDGRLNVEVGKVKFLPSHSTRISEKIKLSELDFTLNNKSSYGYWNMDFAILLLRGQDIIGVNTYAVENFATGEKRDISLTWPGDFYQVTDVKIIPNIDITDPGVYMNLRYKPGNEFDRYEEKRK